MPEIYSLDQLIIDDSFINFCRGVNEDDISFWVQYRLAYPGEQSKLEQARKMVLGIGYMLEQYEQQEALKELKAQLQQRQSQSQEEVPVIILPAKKREKRYWLQYVAAAAILLGGFMLFRLFSGMNKNAERTAIVALNAPLTRQTKNGERKQFKLPDGSTVILNTHSFLTTDSNYGVTNRNVYLTGEAMFDVTHNERMPFLVHMPGFKVKVLGTLFNIKAYPDDRMQEAALIRGKVEIILNNSKQQGFLLRPNEKALIPNKTSEVGGGVRDSVSQPATSLRRLPVVVPVTYSEKDSLVVETAWVHNRLEIYDRKFVDFQSELERLYDVQIEFKDKRVAEYRFSATFERESIRQVLEALQLSYPFSFTIDGRTVTISK